MRLTRYQRACLAVTFALQGCAFLPEGSQAGVWFRIGYEARNSMSIQWDNIPKDPAWKCPLDQPAPASGVPTWMKC